MHRSAHSSAAWTPSKVRPRSSSSEVLETNLSDKKPVWSGAREVEKATRTMGYVTHLCEIQERNIAVRGEWCPPSRFVSQGPNPRDLQM